MLQHSYSVRLVARQRAFSKRRNQSVLRSNSAWNMARVAVSRHSRAIPISYVHSVAFTDHDTRLASASHNCKDENKRENNNSHPGPAHWRQEKKNNWNEKNCDSKEHDNEPGNHADAPQSKKLNGGVICPCRGIFVPEEFLGNELNNAP
jgi:hypothetical protein